MAVLIDADGKETIGGIAQIRDAFTTAAGGKLACSRATMGYAPGNAQVLKFVGIWVTDGSAFSVTETCPPGAPLAPHARAAARKLLAANG